jgi:hypothetical protein
MAGYSGTPLVKKLGVGEGCAVHTIGAPSDYRNLLKPLPAGVRFEAAATASTNIVHVFETQRARRTQGASLTPPHPADPTGKHACPMLRRRVRMTDAKPMTTLLKQAGFQLYSADLGGDDVGGQQGILTTIFEVAPVARLAREIDSTRQHDVETALARFVADHATSRHARMDLGQKQIDKTACPNALVRSSREQAVGHAILNMTPVQK